MVNMYVNRVYVIVGLELNEENDHTITVTLEDEHGGTFKTNAAKEDAKDLHLLRHVVLKLT